MIGLYGQQNSFIKTFTNNEWGYEFVGKLMESEDNCIQLISTARLSEQFGGTFKIRIINEQSGTDTIAYLGSDIGYSIDSGMKSNNAAYTIGTVARGLGVDNLNLTISKFDSKGEKFQYEYGIKNNFERGYGITLDTAGDIVGCGLVAKELGGADNETVVVKIDTLGNEIWTRKIKARYNELKARSVTTDHIGNIYLLADEESSFPSIKQVALIKLNSYGDSLWTKYYPGGTSLAKVIEINKNGNLIASVTADYDGNGRSFTMMELDTSGTVSWSQSYIDEIGLSFAEPFIELKNGGYAACLDVGHPVLLVIDEVGNVLNIQHYEDYGLTSPKDLIELYDGSFAIAGNLLELNQDIPKVMWLIKTNPNGELITSTLEETFPDISIYPNPASDFINIKGLEYNKVLVVNSDGALVTQYNSDERVDISHQRSGTYFLIFLTQKGSYTTTVVKM